MKKTPSSFAAGGLLLCAAFLLTMIFACEQKRDWQGVWADIAPAATETPPPATEVPEKTPEQVAALPLPGPDEIYAAAAPYMLTLHASKGAEIVGRGLLINSSAALALVYVGDYKNEKAVARIGAKSFEASLYGFDPDTGFALARLSGSFAAAAPQARKADIVRGEELLIVAGTAAASPLAVETRAAQGGNSGRDETPLFTNFAAARNLAGAAAFKRDGTFAGVAMIPPSSDLMAVESAEYLFGRCSAMAALPARPAQIADAQAAAPDVVAVTVTQPEVRQEEVPQGRVWFGAGIIELNPAWAARNGIAHQKGLYVKEVRPASPFEAAGVKAGDLLVELAGQKLENSGQLVEVIKSLRPASIVPVRVLSGDGRLLTLAVTPAAKP